MVRDAKIGVDQEVFERQIDTLFNGKQSALATAARISPSSITRISTHWVASRSHFALIANALQVSEEELRVPLEEQSVDEKKAQGELTKSNRTPVLPPGCCDEYFVRQQDVDNIKELMGISGDPEKAKDVQFLTSLKGFPGIGKSELAVRLAMDPDLRATFKGGVAWIEFGKPRQRLSERNGQLEFALSQLHESLTGQSLDGLPLLKNMKDVLRKELKQRSLLLVLDDVWEAEPLQMFREMLPAHCSVLVTTPVSNVFDERSHERVRVYPVTELNNKNARHLLDAVIRSAGLENELTEKFANVLLKLSGYLPATIIVAARTFIKCWRNQWEKEEILEKMHQTLANESIPRLQIQFQQRTISELLCWSLSLLSEKTVRDFSRLRLLGTAKSTVSYSDLESIWPQRTINVVEELSDVGLIRFGGTNKQGEREYGINHFVYEMAEQLAEEVQ